uniref:Aspartyl aminopeptidase n=1 Tax=Meloidogyne javanica TaxID=6303 RepID=A0A915M024_MELJA
MYNTRKAELYDFIRIIRGPCLRVKPISKRTSEQFLQVGVSPYGGGVWRSWFDRDLSIAGQVIFKGAQSEILHKLIDFGRPVLHIPNLAIHLDSDRGKFEFNSEQHLRPILAQVSSDNSTKDEKKVDKDQLISGISITGDHHDILLKSIGELAGCEPEELLDLDLYLYDTQPAKVVARSDQLCGSTVGPILAAKLGIQTIDVGCPQLAMHSI